MKKTTLLLALLLFAAGFGAKPKFLITDQSANSITLSLELDTVHETSIYGNGVEYSLLKIEGFGFNGKSGAPVVPSRVISLMTAEDPNFTVEVLESDVEIRKGCKLFPLQESFFNYAEVDDLSKAEFVVDEDAYKSDEYFPKAVVTHSKTGIMRGVPLSFLSVSPIQYNAAKNEVKIYNKLKVKITYSPNVKTRMSILSKGSLNFLQNKTLNAPQSVRNDVNSFADYGDDILIVTPTKFKAAAEKLAEWQKMKGYDVKIEAQDSWSDASITTTCHDFYKNTSPKPGYVVMFGDHDDVPSKIVTGTGLGEDKVVHTDLYYTCVDGGGDDLPEMATGRISCDDLDEAHMIVDKLIKYEKTPPMQESFYKDHFGCAYYQDHGMSQGEKAQHADRAFVYYVEEIRKYLDNNHGKTGERLYWTKAHTGVKWWNETLFGFGGEVPQDLQRPQYPWTLTKDQVAASFNKGVFLAAYSNHGNSIGWGYSPSKFAFYQPDLLGLVNNGDLLPVVLNIACSVGQFKGTDSFAEDLLSHPNGGAVGNIAASIYSWSGYNEAFYLGLIDAIWPSEELDLSTPHMPDPEITTRTEPIYTMGDVLLQGKFRMTETWHWQEKGDIAHYEMYHYFGDPTTEIWTDVPQEITYATIEDEIAVTEKSVKVTGLNITEGIATLYNPKTGTVVGKGVIKGDKIDIPVKGETGAIGDKVTLTIRSHNYRPLIKEIPITVQTSVLTDIKTAEFSFSEKSLTLHTPLKNSTTLTLTDMLGRTVKSITLAKNSTGVVFDAKRSGLATGVYVLQANLDGQSLIHKMKID